MMIKENIKAGYKKTPAGIIPEDWKMTKIRNIGKVSSGSTPSRSNPDYFVGGDIPWFRTTDLNNSILFDSSEKITEKALAENSLRFYPKGTVVVAMYGGFNQIGRIGLLGVRGTINQALSAIALNDKKADSLFLLYWLNFYVGIWKRYAASSRKDPNITGSDVKSFPFALLKLSEQKAIADCLSTWDRAIEKQTKLIKAKKQFKKGLIQGFFNGQLSINEGQLVKAKEGQGFTEDWEEVRYKQIFKVRNERKVPEKEQLYSLTIENGVTPKTDRYNREFLVKDKGNKKYKIVHTGDVVYNPSNLRWGAIGRHLEDKKVAVSPIYEVLKTSQKYDQDFVYYLVSRPDRIKYYASKTEGTLKERMAVKLDGFLVMKCKVPSVKTQTAIAQVLQSADNEIELLEKKLEQLQLQKKGLMQVLLTGKKRLV